MIIRNVQMFKKILFSISKKGSKTLFIENVEGNVSQRKTDK